MQLLPLHKRVIGLDVHQAQITACALIEGDDGVVHIERRTFETFKRGLRELVRWCLEHNAEVVVMESTGIYWKSPHAWLERAGLNCLVVNATTSRPCRAARPTCATRNGWRRWRAPGS